MRLNFYGAAHEVTGSCHLLEACGKNILIDCGDVYKRQPMNLAPRLNHLRLLRGWKMGL